MDRGMIDRDAALGHHLFRIPQAQAVSQIPSDARQDHQAIEMPAPEHLASPSTAETSGRVATTLKQTVCDRTFQSGSLPKYPTGGLSKTGNLPGPYESGDRTTWIPVQASRYASPNVAERGIWMLMQKVPQRRDKLPSIRNIVLPNGRPYLIHQHVTDLFASTLALEQVIAKHSSRGLGDMLVLGHNLDLGRREIAEAD